MTHPSNETLTAVARRLLAVLDLDGSTAAPPVEFLVLTQQLPFYVSRPDVVERTLARESKRLAALDLSL